MGPAAMLETMGLAALLEERSSGWSSYLPIKAFLMMASRPIELPGVSGAGWLRTLTGPGGWGRRHTARDVKMNVMTVLSVQNETVAWRSIFSHTSSCNHRHYFIIKGRERSTCGCRCRHVEDFRSWLSHIWGEGGKERTFVELSCSVSKLWLITKLNRGQWRLSCSKGERSLSLFFITVLVKSAKINSIFKNTSQNVICNKTFLCKHV